MLHTMLEKSVYYMNLGSVLPFELENKIYVQMQAEGKVFDIFTFVSRKIYVQK